MTTVEFGTSVKTILVQEGFSADDLVRIGSHSLKCTMLSWLAKCGAPRETRRILGYHVAPGDRVLEAYSRDSLAGQLRTLADVIGQVRSKKFLPDTTRSGYFPLPAASVPSSATSSRSGRPSASSLASSDEVSVDFEAEAARHEQDVYVVNLLTKFYHRKATDDEKLACGKPLPFKHEELDELPAGARLCSRCF